MASEAYEFWFSMVCLHPKDLSNSQIVPKMFPICLFAKQNLKNPHKNKSIYIYIYVYILICVYIYMYIYGSGKCGNTFISDYRHEALLSGSIHGKPIMKAKATHPGPSSRK